MTNIEEVFIDDLVEVEWCDAADHKEIDIEDVQKGKSTDYFVYRTAYGRLALRDKYGVFIVTDVMEDGTCEGTSIPRPWLSSKSEKELYDKEMKEECDYNGEKE